MATRVQTETLAQAVKRHRAELLARERQAAVRMMDAYLDAWNRSRSELDIVMALIKERHEAGEEPTRAWLQRQERLEVLQGKIAREMRALESVAGVQIRSVQRDAIALAQTHASDVAALVDASWSALPVSALEDLVGATSGGPLADLLSGIGAQGGEAVRKRLLTGVALGWNPTRMAREAARAGSISLSRALTISRTESLRAYRSSTLRAYQENSGVVTGWVWLSAADLKTCPACWAMHGTKHTLREGHDGHPNCRCTMVPDVDGGPTIPPGEESFTKLPEQAQRRILGPRAHDAWLAGEISLSDLVQRTRSKRWGTMRRRRSLGDALG